MSEEHVNPVATSGERDKNEADSFNVTTLIAEARRWANGHPNRRVSELIHGLVDALEAAARERDAALARIAELEADMERCEGLKAAHMRSVHETVKHNEELLARIAEAAKLHRPILASWMKGERCDVCLNYEGWNETWPCPTAVALGLNEGENDD